MSRKKPKQSLQAHWRPNFRNAETLPDIKVVRTGFLLNLVTISLACVLLGLLVYREYRISTISSAVSAMRANIASTSAADRANVRMSNEFEKVEKQVAEFIAFHNVPGGAADLVHAIAEMQPREVVLNSISFSPTVTRRGRREIVHYQLVLNGTVTDAEDRLATDIITDYRNAYSEMELIRPYFESSELSGFSRDDVLGLFNFTIQVTLTLEPKKAA